MAAARIQSQLKHKTPNSTQILALLDIALIQLQDDFTKSIAQGLDKTSQAPVEQLAMFNQLWEELNAVTTFDSMTELVRLFTQAKKNLVPKKESQYFKKAHQVMLTENFFQMLTAMIDVYAVLAKQRFYLQQIPDQHDADKFTHALADCNLMLTNLVSDGSFNCDAIHKKINKLDATLAKLVEELVRRGYGEINVGFRDYENKDCIAALLQLFATLPVSTDLNAEIDKLEEARQTKNRIKINETETVLLKHIDDIEKVKSELANLAINFVQEYEMILQIIKPQTELFSKNLHTSHAQIKNLSAIFNAILAIHGYVPMQGGMINGYQEIVAVAKEASKTFLEPSNQKNWHLTGEDIEVLLTSFRNHLEKFIQPYLTHLNEFNEINLAMKQQQEKLQAMHAACERLEVFIDKSKKVFNIISAVLTKVQYVLATHASHHETNGEFIQNFFRNHKIGIFFGSTVGISIGSFVAFLVGLSNPITTPALLVGSAVGGFGVSGSIGLTRDILFKKNNFKIGGEVFASPEEQKASASIWQFWRRPNSKKTAEVAPQKSVFVAPKL